MQRKKNQTMESRLMRYFKRAALPAVATLALALWAPRMASATLIAESEPNNTGATAQNVNGFFSNELDPNITNSGPAGLPHVSIQATGDGTFDFYRFTSSGGTIILDIDSNPALGLGSNVDSEIGIWDLAGNLLASNDDLLTSTDPGSTNNFGAGTFDSFIQLNSQAAGDYIVGVCEFNCTFLSNFRITANALDLGESYTLHISTTPGSVPTPEPSAMILLGSGLAGLGAYRRRRNAKKS